VSGEELKNVPVRPDREPLNNRFASIALDQTGSLAAVTNLESLSIQLIETDSGAVRYRLPGNPVDLQFHPTEPRLYSLPRHQRCFDIFNTLTGEQIASVGVNPNSMACSPDGTMVALGLYDGGVVLVDAMTGRELRRARLHSGTVCSVAWTAGGHLLSVGGEEGYDGNSKALRLWEPMTFSPRGTFLGVHSLDVYLTALLDRASGFLLTHQSPPNSGNSTTPR
jgi:WD40 repeat protein